MYIEAYRKNVEKNRKDMDYKREIEIARCQVGFACVVCGVPKLAGKINIEFNNRFTSRMGDANANYMRIRLSSPLWKIATEVQRRETVIHEACHIIDSRKYGVTTSHGRNWQRCMTMCGLEPNRLHRVDTSSVTQVRRRCAVEGCTCVTDPLNDVGSTVGGRMRKGREYHCRKCGNQIFLENVKI
jgi:SprT protein